MSPGSSSASIATGCIAVPPAGRWKRDVFSVHPDSGSRGPGIRPLPGNTKGYMEVQSYRLTFHRPLHGAQIHKLILYLQKELGLSEDNLKRLLASPPRTLVEVPSLQEADRLQAELEKLGCFVVFDGLLSYDNVPFPIPRELAGTIQAELSKTLRCAGNLAFFSVQIKAEDPNVILPSMLGRLPARIAGRLRDSDTVIGIDNNRLIILAFYTDRKGIPIVQNKIINALVEHVGENIRICIGVSLFPEDARTLKDLIVLSESNHLEWENNLYFTPEKPVHTPEDAETPPPGGRPGRFVPPGGLPHQGPRPHLPAAAQHVAPHPLAGAEPALPGQTAGLSRQDAL